MKSAIFGAAFTAMVLIAPAANAVSINPVSATPTGTGPSGNAGISEGNLALALDGNLSTGYLVTNTNANAQGFNVRFDYDVSGFSQVDAFSISFTGVYSSDDPAFEEIRIGASPVQAPLFEVFPSPIGQQVAYTLNTTANGTGANDTDNYFSQNADTISVFFETDLAEGPGSFTEINFQELMADVEGVAIPLPAAAWLLLSSLGGLGLIGWRKKGIASPRT